MTLRLIRGVPPRMARARHTWPPNEWPMRCTGPPARWMTASMVQHRLKDACKRAVASMLHNRQHLRRRPAVMDIAVGQNERIQALGVMGRENLGDGTTAVIAD